MEGCWAADEPFPVDWYCKGQGHKGIPVDTYFVHSCGYQIVIGSRLSLLSCLLLEGYPSWQPHVKPTPLRLPSCKVPFKMQPQRLQRSRCAINVTTQTVEILVVSNGTEAIEVALETLEPMVDLGRFKLPMLPSGSAGLGNGLVG